MAIVVLALWIGSAIAGWYLLWPWLAAPLAVIALWSWRQHSNMKAAMVRNGLRPSSNIPIPMKGETARLLVTTLIQHLVVFGLGAGAHSLIG